MRKSNFSLNRIILPDLGLEEFLKLTSELGLNKVELRNDLPGAGIIDTYSPEQIKELTTKYGIKILSINALQKFNLGEALPDALKELRKLIDLSVSIDCEAIVLVPTNDVNDKRSEDVIFNETVSALKAFEPLFEDSGIIGYVEPLGFKECSLRSKVIAMNAIQESGCNRLKIVHDTFHHYLGPDTLDVFETDYDISYTGLVHISGVESDIQAHQYKDDHRILISPDDKLKNSEQIELLVEQGYDGAISFEPFAKEIQTMEIDALRTAVDESIKLLASLYGNQSVTEHPDM